MARSFGWARRASAGAAGEAASATADARSLLFALSGTFALRCASYSAGLIIAVSLGLKSRSDPTVTVGLASLVAVTFYAAELVGAPLFGSLSDRWGRKSFMLLGPILGGIAVQLIGLTAVIPVLVAVRVLEGLSTASAVPATLSYLSAVTAGSDRLRGRVMGCYEAATVLGLAMGAVLGGTLYERVGTAAFTLVALIYAASLALLLAVRDHQTRGRPPAGAPGIARRLLTRPILRFAPAWLAANAVLGAWFATGPFLAAGAPQPEQRLMGGLSPAVIGGAVLLVGAVFTLGALGWGFVMPRIGRQATLLWSVSALGLTSVLLGQWNRPEPPQWPLSDALLACLVLGGVLVGSGFTPAALAYLAEIAEAQKCDRGAVMGIYSVLLSVGHLLGGALAAPYVGRWGMNGLIMLTGALCLGAMFSVYLLGYRPRRAKVRHYGAAVAATMIAFFVAICVAPLGGPGWAILFLVAVLASAAYGGLRPALVGTAISTICIVYILPPFGALAIASWDDAAALTAFVLIALLGSLLTAGLRRPPERAVESGLP
ncbi:MAG TPA: MFS transporter [Chloroflexota bacterium]|nr:MFS transporter [Chloroflexota bacterium]